MQLGACAQPGKEPECTTVMREAEEEYRRAGTRVMHDGCRPEVVK
jgi:hypothetical protein